MKFVCVAVFMVLVSAVCADLGSVHSVTNKTLVINSTVEVRTSAQLHQLHVPIEEVWASLSEGHRYPIIYSGDIIALRSAYTSGIYTRYWMYCWAVKCYFRTCPGTVITSKGWSSCFQGMMYTITAKGKMDGEPINSGDTVALMAHNYACCSFRLYCSASSSTYCAVKSVTSSWTGSSWLTYSFATFEIYSRNADDGTPVQYGDVVGFKHPYSSNSAWLTYYAGNFYPRSCSSNSKTSCAAENTWTGFKIFKKLS